MKKTRVEGDFDGYPAPTSNTTYVPNQFFDVVLPHSSRGTVRIVSYMLRRILGWSDQDGNPREPQVRFSYKELIEKAGVSRGAIREALDEAIKRRFITCIEVGHEKRQGENAVSSNYELRWDDTSPYTTNRAEFDGFFAGEGNRTFIPNVFFDHTVPTEPLAVVKVVGAILRHTIGFRNRYGHRRARVELSFSGLQRLTNICSRRSLSEAITQALEHGHIVQVEEGYFDADAGRESRASIYGIKWMDWAEQAGEDIGPKRIPAIETRSVQKGYRDKPSDQSKKDTGIGPKRIPGSVQKPNRDRSKKDTGIEITDLKNTSKQQQSEALLLLLSVGFDEGAAEFLADRFPLERIKTQIVELPRRTTTKNRLGMLRKAIEENWSAPVLVAGPAPVAVSEPTKRHPAVVSKGQTSPDREYRLFLEREAAKYRKKRKDLFKRFADYEAETISKLKASPLITEVIISRIQSDFNDPERELGRFGDFLVRERVLPSEDSWAKHHLAEVAEGLGS